MTDLRREPLSLSSELFDVLVIGGGINGAAVAWDAALRGFKTALVEKDDFGGAASAGCFKIVHGGLRYLQHLDFKRIKESVEEQRILRKLAPHLVHPFPFLVPCYGLGLKSKPALRVGMMLYELLAGDRNAEVDSYHNLPKHCFISKERCLEIAPGLSPRGLSGGLVFYDCQMSNCERLTFSVVRAAAEAGARVCNYVKAVKFSVAETDGGRKVDVVTVRDLLNQRELPVRARVVVNAAGPWAKLVQYAAVSPEMHNTESQKPPVFLSKGIQLVTKQFISDYGVAVESRYQDKAAVVSRGKRSFFIHPWRGHSLIGTSDTLFKGDPDTYSVSLEEIRELLADVNQAYQSSALQPAHVRFAFGGLRPIDSQAVDMEGDDNASGEAKVSRSDQIIDHASYSGKEKQAALENFISVIGVKYTTFRALGERVVDLVSQKLRGERIACRTKTSSLCGGDTGLYSEFVAAQAELQPNLNESTLRHLVSEYGSKLSEVFDVFTESAELQHPLVEGNEVLAGEVVHSVRNEMACKLSDVVFRRTGLGTLGFPGKDALEQAAVLMAQELGWDAVRKEEEMQNVLKQFTFS